MRDEVMLLKRLLHCARCGSDHDNIYFWPLTHPIEDTDGTVWTMWAPCPTNGEPILLKLEANHESDESSAGKNSHPSKSD